jgi:hypothetical protein
MVAAEEAKDAGERRKFETTTRGREGGEKREGKGGERGGEDHTSERNYLDVST